MKNFGMSFSSSFIFVVIFFYFLYPDFYMSLIRTFFIRDIFFIIFSCVFSILIENLVFRLKYKKQYCIKIPQNFILLIYISIVIPIAEEILFRGILKYFFDLYNLPSVLYICSSSIFFGLNHQFYSKINILTKAIWGIFFSLSYCFTGNILVPAISHIVINLIYTVMAVRRKSYA